jgi:hypothetical protein
MIENQQSFFCADDDAGTQTNWPRVTRSKSSHQQQHDDDDDHQAQAATGSVASASAVRPDRKCTDQHQYSPLAQIKWIPFTVLYADEQSSK